MKATSKILLFSIFAIFSAQAMEEGYGKITKIKASSIFASNEVGKVDLFHDDKGYHVIQNDEIYPVNKYSADPLLRSLKHKQLKKFQKCGYIHVKKNQDNEFSLVSKIRGNGGGATGAYIGWWVGRTLTSVAGHSTLYLISLASGPMQIPVLTALEATYGPEIEAFSNIIACAAGIAAGAATGPA